MAGHALHLALCTASNRINICARELPPICFCISNFAAANRTSQIYDLLNLPAMLSWQKPMPCHVPKHSCCDTHCSQTALLLLMAEAECGQPAKQSSSAHAMWCCHTTRLRMLLDDICASGSVVGTEQYQIFLQTQDGHSKGL